MKDRIWKYSLKNHKKIKEFVLNEIENTVEDKSLRSDGEYSSSILKTDFFNRVSGKSQGIPEYYSFFEDNIQDFYNILHDLYYIPSLSIENFWFQQYKQDHFHDWHIHPWTTISTVYYVELNDPCYVTEFFDTKTKKKYQPYAEEGDIIVFDSYLPHRSPKIESDSRKTIIATNLNFNSCLDTQRIVNELSQ